jgi:predicted N-acetyltransferase YhbS
MREGGRARSEFPEAQPLGWGTIGGMRGTSEPRVGGKYAPPADCWLHEAVEVRPSAIQGSGLFAVQDLRASTVVARLGGRLISNAEVERLIADRQHDPGRPYVDSIAVDEGANLLIPPGQTIHFANHSCNPNLWHVGPFTLAARRDIAAGEEMTVDYATQTMNPRVRLDCECGSSHCRGTVTGEDWRIEELQERYGEHCVPAVRHKIANSRGKPVSVRARGSGRLTSDFTIRAERSRDRDAIADVVAAAFGSPKESRLVEAIRASPYFVPELSLVAEIQGRVVGHVMVSFVDVYDDHARHRVASLSPLAVGPNNQRRGIGSALVREVISRADARGEPMVILEGSPTFYGQLGFQHAVPHGIRIDLPPWAPPEAAQVTLLRNYDPSIRGRVVYPPAFDDVIEH